MNPTYSPNSAARLRMRSGMTLVEVMIALFVAVFLIAAILTSVVFAARQFTEAKARTNASNIVNQKIEELRSKKFGDLKTALEVDGDGKVGDLSDLSLIKVENQNFSYELVSAYPDSAVSPRTPNKNMVVTTITVGWRVLGQVRRASAKTSFSINGYAKKR